MLFYIIYIIKCLIILIYHDLMILEKEDWFFLGYNFLDLTIISLFSEKNWSYQEK